MAGNFRTRNAGSLLNKQRLWQAILICSCVILCEALFCLSAHSSKNSFDDKHIGIAIEGKLLIDPVVQGHGIDVQVDHGIAKISGFVPALREKML